jgi:hypothetical protein
MNKVLENEMGRFEHSNQRWHGVYAGFLPSLFPLTAAPLKAQRGM